jgi:hypothetical protein
MSTLTRRNKPSTATKTGRLSASAPLTMPSDLPDKAFKASKQAAGRRQSDKPRALLRGASLGARKVFTNLVT